MLKRNMNLGDVKILSAAILPAASLLFVNILAQIWDSIVHNSPSEHSHLMVPAAAQGTAYLVAPHPRQQR